MKRYNMCIGESYEVNGEKRTKWNRIGEMFITSKGDLRAKIYTIPNQLICVFEDKPKEEKKQENIPF
jgi:hypothetical protein